MTKRKFISAMLMSAFLISAAFTSCVAQKKAGPKQKGKAVKLFDGQSLKGWKADTNFWTVEDGSITGTVTPEKQLRENNFCIWEGVLPEEFEFTADFKISKDGNSGVQFQSEEVPGVPFGIKGYQADMDGHNSYTGMIFEERGRGFLAPPGKKTILKKGQDQAEVVGTFGDPEELKKGIHAEDWNKIRVVVKGNNKKVFINDVQTSETTDEDDANAKSSGLLALQLHVSHEMKVQFKNLYLKK